MNAKNREFVMVYSIEELKSRVEEMEKRGYKESDINILADDPDLVNSAETQTGVEAHEAASFTDKFKSFFTGKDKVREELEGLGLESAESDRFRDELANNGILLYTDHQNVDREDENFSSFGDDTRTVDIDEEKHNTAFTPFGRDIERDGRKVNDAKIRDTDVKSPLENPSGNSDEIYTREVSREEQHGEPGYHDKFKDSRTDGENIHPTTGGGRPQDQGSVQEKRMDHEPEINAQDGNRNLNREDGVNKREDEQSPGIDPNLGPAPFGRDSEEEHLADKRRDDPPTPKLF